MLSLLEPFIKSMLEGESGYAEPFVGGGSVALWVARTFPSLRLRLNDKDPLIASAWKVICGSQAGVESLISLLKIKPTVSLWHEVRASEPKTDVDRAFKAVFLNRTSWNGIIYDSRPIGGLNQTSQYAVDCRFTPQTLEKVIRSYHTLLSGRTSVTCCDAVDFVRDSALPFYADPPYLLAGKNKLYGVQMTEQEHRALAAFVKKQPKWFLTYDCKDAILDGLYWGGHRDSPSVRYSMSTGRLKKWEQRSEVVVWQGFKVKLEA